MRRTTLLLLLVAVGALGVLMVEAPHRPTGREAARGPRLVKAPGGEIRELTGTLGERRFTAMRSEHGWQLDGKTASPGEAEALDDLVTTLVDLRAIDAFRPDGDVAQFGLDEPHGALTVVTARRTRRIDLGDFNAAGSAIYARREGDRRVFQVGVFLPSAMERVFYQRDQVEDQRPEIG